MSTSERGAGGGSETGPRRRYPEENGPDHEYGLYSGDMTYASDEGTFAASLPTANPDDPIVRRPPADARGPRPGPDSRGAPGRIAIVQGQVYLVAVIVITQLFLCTMALHELLSGRNYLLWWLALAQLVGFLVALLVMLWPRQRVKGY